MNASTLLADRYEVGEVLGAGGMATVHRGLDVRLGRAVALKVLRPDLARDPAFQARFRREAQAAARLSDTSIVSVYDTGVDADGVPFIVMEQVEGRTLREVLATEGRLLPQRALEVVADVCTALEVAHQAGIVHRDVKPGNVMLTRGGAIKVMDFGIARALADSASTVTDAGLVGTAAYLSPEQARGEHVDPRSDVYSTGCLLYELLTGSVPFSGDSPVAVAYQHVREDPRPPSAYDADLPRDVEAVVLKAMAKNPANRYQGAQEMREDLLRAAAGEPVEATPLLVEGVATTLVPADGRPARPSGPSAARAAVVYGLLAVVVVAVATAVALLVRGVLGNGGDVVPAPKLIGLDQPDAIQALADRGLHLGRLTAQYYDTKPAGTVLQQNPLAGIVVQRGGTVDVLVSRGIQLASVPQLVGATQDQAVAVLEQAHLVPGAVQQRDGDVPAGQVLGQSQPAGRAVRAGSTVDLVVTSGKVAVPDVRGRGSGEAVGLLTKAGLSVAIQPVEDPGPPDRVLDQDVLAGPVSRRTVITVKVSVVPAVRQPSATPSRPPSAPPAAAPAPSRSPAPAPSPF